MTSRSHTQVAEWLQGVTPVELGKNETQNLEDLRSFIREVLQPFNQGNPLSERMVETILEKSEGVFLYVELLRRDLQENHLHLNDFHSFPQGLNGMYQQFFTRQFPDRQVYSVLVRPALKLTTTTFKTLPLTNITN